MAEERERKGGGRQPVVSRALWMPLIVALVVWAFIKRRKAKKKLDPNEE